MEEQGYIDYIDVSGKLDVAGLIWHPEMGDEIALRDNPHKVSILVDSGGLTPGQLRRLYLWLPTVEQLAGQIEARQTKIEHLGLTDRFSYRLVLRHRLQHKIETEQKTIKLAFGFGLWELLTLSRLGSTTASC